jgi:SAM-dependent methyltransferase
MEELAGELRVSGVDLDSDMVTACTARGLDVQEASVYDLPYGDGEFDIVYCTFLLMWLDEPVEALQEMARVSRGWVLCLAEPDFGARIDHPSDLDELRDIVVEGFRARGADPHMGRKLRETYLWAGIPCEIGVHPGVWETDRLKQEFPDEWGYVERAQRGTDPDHLRGLKRAWEHALEMGTYFSFNPVFYALGRK